MRYQQIGLVNTKGLFKEAYRGGYAIPAFNFVCLEQLQAIVEAAMETQSPFILQASSNTVRDLGRHMVMRMAQAAVERMEAEDKKVPMALNLDHGMTYEDCVICIDNGFSSVMIDGSSLPFEENVKLTKKVVEYARQFDVSVEGELGTLSGMEEGVSHAHSKYTDPEMVEEFVKATGVDSLAISIGTSHGVVKVAANPDGTLPELRFDILEEISKRIPGFPIVLHGASHIAPRFVTMINEHGGMLKKAQGIPEDQVKKAASLAVCKVNVASDGWITMTATTRRILDENKETIDPRKFLKASREEMKKVYTHKISDVLGSAGKGVIL